LYHVLQGYDIIKQIIQKITAASASQRPRDAVIFLVLAMIYQTTCCHIRDITILTVWTTEGTIKPLKYSADIASIPLKVKVKFALEQAIKAQRESRHIALLSLTSVPVGGWVVNIMPQPLYAQERDPVPLV
jgi:hypothetical protein